MSPLKQYILETLSDVIFVIIGTLSGDIVWESLWDD